jgi:hypothetical protein
MKNKKNIISIIIILLLIFFAILFLFSQKRSGFIKYDPDAQEGVLPGKSKEDVQNELNQVVSEGMFNISISPSINVNSKTMQGAIRIENIKENHYLMQVDIEENGKKIYSSDAVKPGEYIENAKFQKLPVGTYPATAIFTAIDKDTGMIEGTASAQITITVQ